MLRDLTGSLTATHTLPSIPPLQNWLYLSLLAYLKNKFSRNNFPNLIQTVPQLSQIEDALTLALELDIEFTI